MRASDRQKTITENIAGEKTRDCVNRLTKLEHTVASYALHPDCEMSKFDHFDLWKSLVSDVG